MSIYMCVGISADVCMDMCINKYVVEVHVPTCVWQHVHVTYRDSDFRCWGPCTYGPVMAYIVMAYIAMAYVVMALPPR